MTIGIVQVPILAPLYDLLIASRKYGYNLTSQTDAPITWLKAAGFPQRSPQVENTTLAHPTVQKFLEGYELVDTEVKPFEIIRKYRKVKGE